MRTPQGAEGLKGVNRPFAGGEEAIGAFRAGAYPSFGERVGPRALRRSRYDDCAVAREDGVERGGELACGPERGGTSARSAGMHAEADDRQPRCRLPTRADDILGKRDYGYVTPLETRSMLGQNLVPAA
ncbi:hypothetical protein GCM10010246_58540 [Streptomyces cuspidosporus]|uniref:Uncharacterized protein n=1 Tax=Streptomyces cuspidosporus TaxID=66882 RepID=A0ABN3GU68_9ACTN